MPRHVRNSNSRNLRARAAALRDRGRRALDDGDQGDFIASLILLPAILVFTCLLTAIPAALVVWKSEVSRIRSALFFGFAGGAIGVLSQTIVFQSFVFPAAAFFASAGFVAGLTYWRVAAKPVGRESGPVIAAISRSPG
jgi:Na+/H+ antiporter NhaC